MELAGLKSRWGTEKREGGVRERGILSGPFIVDFLIAMLFVDSIGNKKLINVRLTQ